jgi:hypothetical protein
MAGRRLDAVFDEQVTQGFPKQTAHGRAKAEPLFDLVLKLSEAVAVSDGEHENLVGGPRRALRLLDVTGAAERLTRARFDAVGAAGDDAMDFQLTAALGEMFRVRQAALDAPVTVPFADGILEGKDVHGLPSALRG